MLQLLWIFIAGNSQWFRKNNYYPLKWHVVIYSSHKLAIDIQRTFYPRFLLDIIQLFYASTYTESYFLCIHLFTINLENFNSYVKALTTNTHPWVSNICILPGIFTLTYLTISSQLLFFLEFSNMTFLNDILVRNISSNIWNVFRNWPKLVMISWKVFIESCLIFENCPNGLCRFKLKLT